MIGSRAWFALMRRNAKYRQRHWISTLLEMTMPIAFCGILIAIKNSLGDDIATAEVIEPTFPTSEDVYRPLSFRDYVTTLQAAKICTAALDIDTLLGGGGGSSSSSGGNDEDEDEEDFEPSYTSDWDITGMPFQGYDWQNPFVRCNNLKCEEEGQDAQPFCEYGILGVAPKYNGNDEQETRARAFYDYIYDTYPALSLTDSLPFEFDFIQWFPSENAMEDYVTSTDYGSLNKPKLTLGVVWESGANNDYQYTLRQNATGYNVPSEAARPGALTTPDTSRIFDPYAPNDEACGVFEGAAFTGPRQFSCTGQYLYNGIITIQKLVGDFILNDANVPTTIADHGIRLVTFPTRQYEEGGFFEQIAGTYYIRLVC